MLVFLHHFVLPHFVERYMHGIAAQLQDRGDVTLKRVAHHQQPAHVGVKHITEPLILVARLVRHDDHVIEKLPKT